MNRLDKQKGISLIVLTITIIVMIIIAGAIIIGISNSNIIEKASDASDKYNESMGKEEDVLYAAENLLASQDNGGEFNSWDIQGKVLSYDSNTTITDEYGNEIVVPAGFMITKDAKNVVEGIVIEDRTSAPTRGSQFVWIPVGSVKTDANGTTIENPLERYYGTSDTKMGSNDISYRGLKFTVNVDETRDFIASVDSNKGYYIGRYEARSSRNTIRTGDDRANPTADQVTCIASHNIYNYVKYEDALYLSKGMYDSTLFTSNLVNSYAWDTALEYFETVTTATNYSETISRNQGSETGKVNFAWKGTVGTNTVDKICNVYDMASNCYEWSTEKVLDGLSDARIARGGVYSSNIRTAGSREICNINIKQNPEAKGYHTQTFRVILYCK